MAVHGRLAGDVSHPPKPGVLASIRDLRVRVGTLDRIIDDIAIDAVLLMADGSGAIYSFMVSAAQGELACGRATVVFDIGLR